MSQAAAKQPEVTERPIIFSASDVRGILEGRKTQTRRPIKPQPKRIPFPCHFAASGWALSDADEPRACSCEPIPCKHAADRLWVKEPLHWNGRLVYVADGTAIAFNKIPDEAKAISRETLAASHMPQWASRLTLEVQRLRLEKLQDIREADAIAEGLQRSGRTGLYPSPQGNCEFATWAYRYAWDDLNAKRGHSWASNPWVWVIEFKKL